MSWKQLSSYFIMTIIAATLKNTLDLHSKIHICNNKFWKMGTIVQFWLLVLDSLKYSSKMESPINRFTKAVISRNLNTTWHNHLFIYLFFYFYFLFIFYPIFTENSHHLLICIVIKTIAISWPEWIKNIYL